jgi:hypothetical protein
MEKRAVETRVKVKICIGRVYLILKYKNNNPRRLIQKMAFSGLVGMSLQIFDPSLCPVLQHLFNTRWVY